MIVIIPKQSVSFVIGLFFNELKNNLLSAIQDFHATHWLEIKAFKDNKKTLNVSAVQR